MALQICENDVSTAWAKAFLEIMSPGGKEIAPLYFEITVEDDSPVERPEIRELLDDTLEELGKQSVQTIANTIFPQTIWRSANGNRQILFERYKNNLPHYKKLEKVLNKRGLYFERLIDFGGGPSNGNQLEYIITAYLKPYGVVRSKFQASIFDPRRDHVTDARQGFPCLQHVTFLPHKGQLHLNAFYATQLIFEKAYGNLLGLVRLGRFMSSEMKLEFAGLNCMVGVEKLSDISKTSLRTLEAELKAII